jgi:sensor domain CHASE-containing protein
MLERLKKGMKIKKRIRMRIQTKIVLLLTSVIFMCLLILLFIRSNEESRSRILLLEATNRESQFFDKIINMKKSPLEMIAIDYTHWDEMVNFIASKDKKWAKETVDDALLTYKINSIWIYDTLCSLIHSKHNYKTDSTKGIPISNDQLSGLFKNNKIIHFYIKIPEGLMEIQGATIHPSIDFQRVTPKRGYFLAGRLWNNDFISELKNLTECSIEILPYRDTNSTIENQEKNKIMFTKTLYGFDNSPIFQINISKEYSILEQSTGLSNRFILLVIIFGGLLLIILAYYLSNWISIPLLSISRTLSSENPDLLNPLIKKKNEFGEIALLINRFFEQKQELIKEIKERKEAETTLQKRDKLVLGVAKANNQLFTSLEFTFSVEESLKSLGKLCEIDRIYIFENQVDMDSGEYLMNLKFEWSKSEDIAQIRNPLFQNLSYERYFSRWYENL